MHDLTVTGNRIEALLWFAFAAGFFIRAFRKDGGHRRLAGILALAFAAFGVSDLIEARTGAWWRPHWLMIFKALLCFVTPAVALRSLQRVSIERSWEFIPAGILFLAMAGVIVVTLVR
ncbi:MAG: hypothetical protein AB7O66_02280 [Limisphaerales bacterium]